MRLLVPSAIHFLRPLIEGAFARIGARLEIAAEINSRATLRDALRANLGISVLPHAAFADVARQDRLQIRPLRQPRLEATVSLGVSDQLPTTELGQGRRAHHPATGRRGRRRGRMARRSPSGTRPQP